jgi:hypothetical protein
MSESDKYAPILERMVTLLGADEKLKFGEALKRASSELSIDVPEHMEGPLLISAFRVIGSGKIPGAPDA